MTKYLFSVILLGVLAAGCKKSTEEFLSAPLSDYAPYTVGKYITYRLDSLVFVNFGSTSEVHTYEVKYEVDAEITDNLGRPAYRIIRYIRNLPSDPWNPDNTFMAVNTGNSLEFIEDNERYIKLRQPVRDGYSWKGNTYIDTYSLYSEKKYLDGWDYMYDGIDVPESYNGHNVEVLIVDQRDEVIGNPNDPNSYSEINQGLEKYAKGVGMVYRHFLHTEYQPPVPGRDGHFVDGSYGITLTMIDHN